MKETKSVPDHKGCSNCIYFCINKAKGGIANGTCDYILIENKRRGCPSGSKCTKRVKRTKGTWKQ